MIQAATMFCCKQDTKPFSCIGKPSSAQAKAKGRNGRFLKNYLDGFISFGDAGMVEIWIYYGARLP